MTDEYDKTDIADLNHYIARLETDLQEMNQSFDLRWEADQRAIKRWQEETGKELTWPDHADMCVWLLSKLDKIRDFAQHKNDCNGYPALSEEDVKKNCDCGLQQLLGEYNEQHGTPGGESHTD